LRLFVDTSVWSLALRHDLTIPTTDADFARVAEHHRLALWRAR
jgi:predicted nuclease of predicted toxin-antitoxin system